MNRKFRNFQEEQKGLNMLGLEFFVRELKRNRKVWIMLGNSYINTLQMILIFTLSQHVWI